MTPKLGKTRVVVLALIACVLIVSVRGGDLHASTGAAYSGWFDFGFAPLQGTTCGVGTWQTGRGMIVVCQRAPYRFHNYYLSLGLYYNYQTPSGWSGWQALSQPPPGTSGTPAVVRDAWGQLHVFVRGTDSTLWENFLGINSGTWSGWGYVGMSLSSDPVAWVEDTSLFLFGRGMDGALWARQTDQSGVWQPWRSLGGFMTTDRPVVTQSQFAEFKVFVVGGDQGIYAMPGGLYHGFGAWESIGGTATTGVGAGFDSALFPSVGGNYQTAAFIFWRGPDGQLYENWEDITASHWHGPVALGGTMASTPNQPPMVGVNADGRLEVFVVSTDDLLWHRYMVNPPALDYWNW